MKIKHISVGLILLSASMLPLQSCIGSFSLTNKVLSWNHNVGSKFVNELVFFAFWILPVYEVTAVADLLVINSIEFWSGSSPVESAQQVIETEEGSYLIASDNIGYTITSPDGSTIRLEYEDETMTWGLKLSEDEIIPFMTMIDDSHVKMLSVDGEFHIVELNNAGVMAYANECGANKIFS